MTYTSFAPKLECFRMRQSSVNRTRRVAWAAMATLGILVGSTASAQSIYEHTTDPSGTTFVVASRGTTLYRDGKDLCRGYCEPTVSAASFRPKPLPTPPPDGVETAAPSHNFLDPGTIAQTPTLAPRPVSPPQSAAAATPAEHADDGRMSKEQKALIMNAGGAAAITIYGIAFWDYFQTSPKAEGEGWFGRTTKHGGVDKLGHFWGTYTLGHLFSNVYRRWDYAPQEANTYGAMSSLGLQTLMEVGDAFSSGFGFSYEDALMNVAGAGAAYVLGRYPSLARKIDFRLEYRPDTFSDLTNDVLTDYDNQRYILALKLDGFDALRDSYLGYLELHAGYYSEGYEDFSPGSPDNRQRNLYFGIGINVSKLVQKYIDTSVFDYFQVPHTTGGFDKALD